MSRQEDLIYIKKTIQGDLNSFSFLVDKYKQKVYHLSLRIVKDTEDAEEVSQDVFLSVFRALKKFKGDAQFSTWLYRITYNAAVSKIRKKRVETVSYDQTDFNFDHGEAASAIRELVDGDRKKFLKEAIDNLPGDETALVNLYYEQDKPMDEIAEIMGMTHVNVRVKLSRIRKKLYIYLSQRLKNEVGGIL